MSTQNAFVSPLSPVPTSLKLTARHDQNGGPELKHGPFLAFSRPKSHAELMFVGLKPDMIQSEVNVFNLMHGLASEVGKGEADIAG